MELLNKNIGYALTGSFCTFEKSIDIIEKLVQTSANIFPIMSYNSYNMDTKFGKAKDFIDRIEAITGHKIIHTIQSAEPIRTK